MFQRVGTRWVVGMSGVVGLRWEAIYPLVDRLELSSAEWDELIANLETMERGALEEINRKDD